MSAVVEFVIVPILVVWCLWAVRVVTSQPGESSDPEGTSFCKSSHVAGWRVDMKKL